jgi:hypothetical protein
MTQQAQSIYLYSQRKTVDYPGISNAAELEQVIQRLGVDYILVAPNLKWRADGNLAYDKYTREVFLPLLNTLTARNQLRLVYESAEDKVQVYQVLESQ